MKKPYAKSTLKRLYGQLNMKLAQIGTDVFALDDYIEACVNFYRIIEADEAWRIIPYALPKTSPLRNLPQELFDEFLSVAARDAGRAYRVLPDKEFFSNGGDGLYIVDDYLTFIPNPKFGDEDRKRLIDCLERGEEYTGPAIGLCSYDRFFELERQREGKPIYVPKNILVYLDDAYYERTPQVIAMEAFLRTNAKVDKNKIKSVMFDMLDDICDISISIQDLFSLSTENIERCGGRIEGETQFGRFTDLLLDLSNNTRMPCNCGFTPHEMSAKTGGGQPKSISFGPGIQHSIRSGDLDAEKMMDAIASMELPLELKQSMLDEINKAALGKKK